MSCEICEFCNKSIKSNYIKKHISSTLHYNNVYKYMNDPQHNYRFNQLLINDLKYNKQLIININDTLYYYYTYFNDVVTLSVCENSEKGIITHFTNVYLYDILEQILINNYTSFKFIQLHNFDDYRLQDLLNAPAH